MSSKPISSSSESLIVHERDGKIVLEQIDAQPDQPDLGAQSSSGGTGYPPRFITVTTIAVWATPDEPLVSEVTAYLNSFFAISLLAPPIVGDVLGIIGAVGGNACVTATVVDGPNASPLGLSITYGGFYWSFFPSYAVQT